MEPPVDGIRRLRRRDVVLALALLGLGLFMRSWSASSRLPPVGDERVYQTYVEWTQRHGFLAYADLVESFLQSQQREKEPLLPPTRIVFVAGGRLVQALTGWTAIDSLRHFALLSSSALLATIWILAWQLRGPPLAHASLLLLAVSPLQLHCARYAFVDVVFALAVAVGLLAVVSARAGRTRFAAATLAGAIPLVLLTKESAVFALPALLVCLWLPFRQGDAATRRLLVLGLFGGGALSAVAVGWFFGGPGPFLECVLMLAAKTKTSDYSATYQNGPWFRYGLDYLLMAPVMLLAFVSCLGRARRALTPGGDALLLFLGLSLAPMSLLEAGFNLRFALMWDPCLRVFVAAGLLQFGRCDPARSRLSWLAVVAVASAELSHYLRFFAHGELYDPVTLALLRALGGYRGDYLYDP